MAEKKVFLVAAFRREAGPTDPIPISGMAEDVVAVIGMAGQRQRFAWVGSDQQDSVANPALVTPVKVRLALPSPWHVADDVFTGLVQLAPAQLGTGTVDEDVDHLLAELARSRAEGPAAGASVSFLAPEADLMSDSGEPGIYDAAKRDSSC